MALMVTHHEGAVSMTPVPQKFFKAGTNPETGEPLWFGRERKQKTLDEFFGIPLSDCQRRAIQADGVDM
jgi:hypothetical protein